MANKDKPFCTRPTFRTPKTGEPYCISCGVGEEDHNG